MKLKQLLATIAISAVTAFAVVWTYGKYVKNENMYAGQQNGAIPSNYKLTGLTENNIPTGAIDFTQPAWHWFLFLYALRWVTLLPQVV